MRDPESHSVVALARATLQDRQLLSFPLSCPRRARRREVLGPGGRGVVGSLHVGMVDVGSLWPSTSVFWVEFEGVLGEKGVLEALGI